uniref:Uncharacterized protein n=1 Tax=Anguilla anguilla TaxID=7936 RepID=A0A0E9U4Q9_ANGAN
MLSSEAWSAIVLFTPLTTSFSTAIASEEHTLDTAGAGRLQLADPLEKVTGLR